MRYIASALLFLLLVRTSVPAQTGPSSSATAAGSGHHHHGAAATGPVVKVKATVDKEQIIIGQPIQLMLEATVPGGAPLVWPPLDSIPHFEWMEKGKVDSVVNPNNRYYRQYLTVTSFDSGSRVIPPLPFLAGNKKYFTDSVRIEVAYTRIDPKQDYHDIKDIIDVPNPFAKWIGWIVAGVTLLSVVFVIWLVRKKQLLKIFTPAVEAPRLSPYEEAMQQLAALEKERPAESGSVKLYYTRMNDILRLFVLRRLGIASLAETNEELIGQLRKLPIPPEQFQSLAETLHMSDFVKFAKYRPGVADHEQNLVVVRQSVEILNEIAEREAAAAAPLSAANK